MTPPRDPVLVAAFERGRRRGCQRQRFNNANPYSVSRPFQRDAWAAGFAYGSDEGPPA